MDDVDDEMQGQDEVIKALENVKRQHQKELVDQGHVHLYQLKALQGQLLDTLIAQVSDPDQNIDAEIKQEIMKSIKKSIDGGGPSSDESGKCRYHMPPINMMMPSSSNTAPLSDSCQLHHSFTSQSNDQSLTPSTTAEPHEGNVPSGSIRYPLSPRSLNMVCPPVHIPRPSSSDDKWKDENKLILSENKNLKIKNEELTKEIERYIRANESLEDKLKKLQLQLQRYETAQDSQSKLNSSLHSRLTSTTNQLNEFEKTINNMKEQIQMQNKECENLKQENVEVNKMFQQSITEMEHLSHENMTLKDEIKYLNEQTFDMENELSQLKSINDRHQYNEVQYQSIIHHLEDDIKNLQHITTTNHEHSHYTHNISSSPTRYINSMSYTDAISVPLSQGYYIITVQYRQFLHTISILQLLVVLANSNNLLLARNGWRQVKEVWSLARHLTVRHFNHCRLVAIC
jgi:hypothetical protein